MKISDSNVVEVKPKLQDADIESRFRGNTYQKLDPTKLNKDTKVYMLGMTQNGQLGIGAVKEHFIDKPIALQVNVNFKQITLGAGHVVALSNAGMVYSWGLNLLG